MDPRHLVRLKQEGGAFPPEDMRNFLRALLADEVSDAQTAALMAMVFAHGMTGQELVDWTRAKLDFTKILERGSSGRPRLDKHSTGGVGDKVSLALAPALIACGAEVPMISGRGLGHTGGTLDKLEAIPGMRTELGFEEIREIVEEVGGVIAAQTKELVPADGRLYALRDHTGLVESIPLIASSILSKKLAEDLDGLVLDVKFGSGAFMGDEARGAELAVTLREVAQAFGLEARVLRTCMDAPLGQAVGHALEVAEAVECMSSRGPSDLRELVVRLGGEALAAVKLAADAEEGALQIGEALDDASARDVFARMIAAQGGDPEVTEDLTRLPRTTTRSLWLSPASGQLDVVDCRRIGLAAAALGGGRLRKNDSIDPAVGVLWLRRPGDDVKVGDALAELHHDDARGMEAAEAHLEAAIAFDTGRELSPLVAGD